MERRGFEGLGVGTTIPAGSIIAPQMMWDGEQMVVGSGELVMMHWQVSKANGLPQLDVGRRRRRVRILLAVTGGAVGHYSTIIERGWDASRRWLKDTNQPQYL